MESLVTILVATLDACTHLLVADVACLVDGKLVQILEYYLVVDLPISTAVWGLFRRPLQAP